MDLPQLMYYIRTVAVAVLRILLLMSLPPQRNKLVGRHSHLATDELERQLSDFPTTKPINQAA
jgi:hypothetical protein